LETADALATVRPERAQEAIRRALGLARSNLEEARRSVMNLRAAPLQNKTLIEALAALVQEGCEERSAQVEFAYTPVHNFPVLSPRLEESLYRIAQEALVNACNHAQAQYISMTLTLDEQSVQMMIQDDGHGFDPEKVTGQTGMGNEGHFGLTGMSERAKLLGGTLCIESEPGAGTCIMVCVPYTQ